MPVLDEDRKGLLPGRGRPGARLSAGGPGRGPGRGAGCGRSGACWPPVASGGSAGGSGAWGSSATGVGTGASATTGCSSTRSTTGGSGSATGSGVGGAGFGAVFLAATFFAGLVLFFAAPSPGAGIASRTRRTTGASIVDDAERTNSPISCSLASTVLLETPSSFASS